MQLPVFVTNVLKKPVLLHKNMSITLHSSAPQLIVNPERNNRLDPTIRFCSVIRKNVDSWQAQIEPHMNLEPENHK